MVKTPAHSKSNVICSAMWEYEWPPLVILSTSARKLAKPLQNNLSDMKRPSLGVEV
jgi:hypothetical protein